MIFSYNKLRHTYQHTHKVYEVIVHWICDLYVQTHVDMCFIFHTYNGSLTKAHITLKISPMEPKMPNMKKTWKILHTLSDASEKEVEYFKINCEERNTHLEYCALRDAQYSYTESEVTMRLHIWQILQSETQQHKQNTMETWNVIQQMSVLANIASAKPYAISELEYQFQCRFHFDDWWTERAGTRRRTGVKRNLFTRRSK